MTDRSFDPPGPGTWRLVDDHFSRPLSRYYATIDGGPMEEGYNEAAAKHGWLTERKTALVDRFFYMTQRPITPDTPADEGAGIPFEERVERLRETYAEKAWRQTIERWDEEWKPSIRETGRELIETDPESLGDEQLIDHLDACREITWNAHAYHFRVVPLLTLTAGDFLASGAEWTGRSEGELLGLLDGNTPASAGLDDELSRVAETMDHDPVAESILFGDDPPPTIIERLRTRPGETGEAVENWIQIAGYRIVSGYDIADSYALEEPASLVRTLRTAVSEGKDAKVDEESGERPDLRSAVPADQSEDFDAKLDEAQAIWRIRDESSLLGLWSQGILRRGLLAAGERLTDADRLHHPEHVVELTHDEVLAALRNESGPSADDVEQYFDYRLSHNSEDAPATLESEPSESLAVLQNADLPEPAARAVQARGAIQRAWTWGRNGDVSQSDGAIEGLAASPGTYDGTARIINGPEDFSAIEDGDVLVAELTSSAFNVVLPLLGGIVTDKGGMLSHPAIVAREFGIPAVVGCEEATERIQDGQQILIDGDAGTVRIDE